MSGRVIRCAVYTRKSTDEGLDQAFNSLDAQREACEAYVRSQASEGWKLIPTRYDDGGWSGGNMDRPALRQLLADVDAGLVDTIVVYKIDRLTRSLADFARIVDRLEKAAASFVSVTQSFNTTTSMGRLTLNVLLSFAQFEREVTGERIRDKIAASKKKGMWMGGLPPIGYGVPTDRQTRALAVDDAEAERVRTIFTRYLELRSVPKLEAELQVLGWVTPVRRTAKGKASGGRPFQHGALRALLQNRVYLGEITHKGQSMPGAHPPIVARELFDAVQAVMAENSVARADRTTRSAGAPLKGLVFDVDGHRMSPSFGYGRGGKVYRYYTSAPLQKGRSVTVIDGALRRVSGETLDEVVRVELAAAASRPIEAPLTEMLPAIRRIQVDVAEIRIDVDHGMLKGADRSKFTRIDNGLHQLIIAYRCKTRGGRVLLEAPNGKAPRVTKRDPVLIKGLRQAHRLAKAMGWNASDGALSGDAGQAPKSPYERKLCRLAFLAPDIQRAILEGSQPRALTLDHLLHAPLPADWAEQRRLFGFAS